MQEELIWADYYLLAFMFFGLAFLIYIAFREKVKKKKARKEQLYIEIISSTSLVLMGVMSFLHISGLIERFYYALSMPVIFWSAAILYFVVRWKMRKSKHARNS
ncbi:MAG: hypothetical protein PWQ22_633 [Archaeoglobaceae archaeon]|nr:hypothetical protein [Archaeoglobaceae archaeon]